MKKKLIIFIVILAVIAGIAGFYYHQKNTYSKEVLKLEILGPDKADLAEEIEYVVKYKNNGNIRLEEPKLIFECPEYSLECVLVGQSETPAEEKSLRKNLVLQVVYPGQERVLKIRARLLGKEGENKTAQAWLSYRPRNIKPRYEANTAFITTIKKVPINLVLDFPAKAESGKEIQFRINYFSNLDYSLSDLRCSAEYPSSFDFLESTPEAIEKSEWSRDSLNKTEGERIEVLGRIRGEVGERKTFKVKLGVWQEGELVLLKETAKEIEIVKPSLYLSQQINGNPQYVANPGDLLHYEILFRNIGQESLSNLVLVSRLEGKAYDFYSIEAPSGEFRPGDNSIVFESGRVSELQLLNVQQQGKVEFWVDLKDNWEISGPEDKNAVIGNEVYLSQAVEEFVNKVNSKLEFSQRAYFQDVPQEFWTGEENSGPIPPKVGEPTTYVVVWQVKNYYNDLKEAKAKVILPQDVKLTGKIFPEQESSKFTFDDKSREIIWEIGSLEAGTDSGTYIAFQVALTPSYLEEGETPEIINKAKVSGEDSWTANILEAEAEAIDTSSASIPSEQRE